ncbi:hypothetical protein [Streptomyces sp. NPDC091268]|uniref:hypothetical protein n=1 Tax=Streptomyces sp. NPDC091268 TaxID=3365979 RepID=UPI00380637F2
MTLRGARVGAQLGEEFGRCPGYGGIWRDGGWSGCALMGAQWCLYRCQAPTKL